MIYAITYTVSFQPKNERIFKLMRTIYEINAFTDGSADSGNKAGVCLLNSITELTFTQMQNIATKLNFSETVFVTRVAERTFRLVFFTPVNEVDICGHATVAAFHCLKIKENLRDGQYSILTNAGKFKGRLKKDMFIMDQQLPIYSNLCSNKEDICSSLNITHKELCRTVPIISISTGLKDIFVPVRNTEVLYSIKPDFDKVAEVSLRNNCIGYHIFSIEENSKIDAHCRNLAPLYGIEEESATGTSNGALACYLFSNGYKKEKYCFMQGGIVGTTGRITAYIQSSGERIETISVGGTADFVQVIEL